MFLDPNSPTPSFAFGKCNLYNDIRNFLSGYISQGIGFSSDDYLVWYILFIVFVPYAMLPLPLRWCMMAGATSGCSHILVTIFAKMVNNHVSPLFSLSFNQYII